MINKVAVITGASSGIGAALAKVFALHDYHVVLAARSIDNITAAEDIFKQESLAVKCDVTDENDCRQLISETIAKFGRIDVLINNAGISMRALFEEVDLDVLRKVMDVNFWGTVYCSKYALPHLLKSGGSLAGISSIAGKKGLPARTGYSASKFAMEGFLETVRIENLKNNLHVLVACPGFTSSNIRKKALSSTGSEQGESPREEEKMMSSEEVAERIFHAIVNRRRDLILTSEGKFTVFMNKFFPSMMDRLVYNHMARESDSPLKR